MGSELEALSAKAEDMSILLWTSTFITRKTVFGMSCRAIITFLAWYYPTKKKNGISAYGDGGICGISVNIKRCFTPTC